MATKIFYFTGTGNSLALARKIADGLGESELLSIPQVLTGAVDTVAPVVGLVFPVYIWGMPPIVVEFVKQLKPQPGQYIFAVTNCAGQPGETLVQLQKLLQAQGAALDAGFAVQEPPNMMQKENVFIKIARWLEPQTIVKPGQERLPEILAVIQKRRQHAPETNSGKLNVYGRLIYKLASPQIKKMDNFTVDARCNGCRTCERICPRTNIKLSNQKPTWQHNCEACQACIQWCPQGAIHTPNEDVSRRYHHPEVTVKELFLR